MPDYQLWICDSAYARLAYINDWTGVSYSQRLNGAGTATVDIRANDTKLALMDIVDSSGADRLRRLQIIRDGVHVFGGMIETEGWRLPDAAPEGERWTLHAIDHAVYLNWRLIIPGAGDDVYTTDGTADDVLKHLVRYHAGASAAAARQFSDITVAADAGAAPHYDAEERYAILLNALIKIAGRDRVWWRMVPTLTGCTFTTGYALFGVDRTRGNGVEDECVFTMDRRNFAGLDWAHDRSTHANYIYVGGQGEGAERTIVERTDATASAALLRREQFVDARQMTVTASLQARGDAALQEFSAIDSMTLRPATGTWKATTGTHWDLGDKVTAEITTYRTFSVEPVITGIDVTLSMGTGGVVEMVTPIMETF
jgi:hypothetical protein